MARSRLFIQPAWILCHPGVQAGGGRSVVGEGGVVLAKRGRLRALGMYTSGTGALTCVSDSYGWLRLETRCRHRPCRCRVKCTAASHCLRCISVSVFLECAAFLPTLPTLHGNIVKPDVSTCGVPPTQNEGVKNR